MLCLVCLCVEASLITISMFSVLRQMTLARILALHRCVYVCVYACISVCSGRCIFMRLCDHLVLEAVCFSWGGHRRGGAWGCLCGS